MSRALEGIKVNKKAIDVDLNRAALRHLARSKMMDQRNLNRPG